MVKLTSDNRTAEERARDLGAGTVVLGGLFNSPSYTESYQAAAAMLLSATRGREELVDIALPLFFLQRHTLELCLKDVVGSMMSLADGEEELAAPADAAWRAILRARETLDRRELFTHEIDELCELAKRYVDATPFGPLPEAFVSVAALVQDFEQGRVERARYSRVKRRRTEGNSATSSLPQALGDVVRLPLGEIQEALDALIAEHMWVDSSRSDTCFMNDIAIELMAQGQALERAGRW